MRPWPLAYCCLLHIRVARDREGHGPEPLLRLVSAPLARTDGAFAALAAYERSLKDSPNRLNGLSGAAHAAQLAGDRQKAREYYVKVASLFSAKARPETPQPQLTATSQR